MLGEMFNNKIRAIALSVSAAVQWIAIAVAKIFRTLKSPGLAESISLLVLTNMATAIIL
jgi:hypothetical protein